MRAAAWPIERLDAFGDPELHRLTGNGTNKGRDTELQRAYEAVLERERVDLWARTLGDSQFEKALALSSLSARSRALSAATRRNGPRNRSMRLSEHTLYRYLARAAGRTTPHGLWAGVTEVGFGQYTGVETLQPHCRFTPDLRPFQALMRGLAARTEYRHRACWRLNPTLRAAPKGGWVFLARLNDGRLEKRELGSDTAVSLALSFLAELPPMRLDVLAVEVARRGALPVGSRRHLLHLFRALADGGALVGGMELPSHFETAWEALERAGEDLRTEDSDAWKSTVQGLAEQCDHLSSDLWTLTTDTFVDRLGAAARQIVNLTRTFELGDVTVPEQVLRCDLHLPWRVTLHRTQRQRLLDMLCAYDRHWLRGASPAAGLREAHRVRLRELVGAGMPIVDAAERLAKEQPIPSQTWPRPCDIEDHRLRERLNAWEGCLKTGESEAVLTPAIEPSALPATPVGCLFAGITDDLQLSVRTLSDIPSLATGRFGGILENQGITEWVREQFWQSSRNSGISLAELRAPFEVNPNVLAGPSLVSNSVDPWGASLDSRSLLDAKVRALGAMGQLVLDLPGDGGPWAVVSRGGADLQSGDPVAQLLLWTGFHESPGRNQRAVDVPTASELEEPGYSPRIRLPGGSLLRHRRSVLAADLSRLKQARGYERFCAWQALARGFGWPELLQVSVAGGEAIPLHRDSPIGVEAIFKGVGPGTAYIAVEEALPRSQLSIPGQGTHLAELVLPFARVSQ